MCKCASLTFDDPGFFKLVKLRLSFALFGFLASGWSPTRHIGPTSNVNLGLSLMRNEPTLPRIG